MTLAIKSLPSPDEQVDQLDLSVVIPCLNEVVTLAACIQKAHRTFEILGLRGEVVVSDNGSTDGSIELAASLGARVVHAQERGYGNALRHGMHEARGRWLVMGDADDTYDFGELGRFTKELASGAEFVMGTRLGKGTILPGANPLLNRYLGTPVLTFILNRLFGTRIRDVNCGMRALTKDAFLRLDLRSEGMEFASEMVIRAALLKFEIAEVPVTLHPDRRGRPPHLRRWRDGWRHLQFMLLHAPDQLLFKPGFVALVFGLTLAIPVAFGPRALFGRTFDFHSLFLGGTLALIGLQGVLGALVTRTLVQGIVLRPSRIADRLAGALTFGRGLFIGALLFGVGLVLDLFVLGAWIGSDLGALNEPRRSVIAMLLMGAGAEIGLFAFLNEVLRSHRPPASRAGLRLESAQ